MRIWSRIVKGTQVILGNLDTKSRGGRKPGQKNKKYPKQMMVQRWKMRNPDGSRNACAKQLGISINTVRKWWDVPLPENSKGKEESNGQP